MSILIRAITCDCGKWHATAGITPSTTCTCGRLLWTMVWDLDHVGFAGTGTPSEVSPA